MRDVATRTSAARAALVLGLLACADDPAVVFVPGDTFQESLALSTELGTSPTVRVNEALIIHARRTAGPWVQVGRNEVKEGQCWSGSAPPGVEPEVADNVRWLVMPDSVAVFNVQYRQDRTRQVRFPRAGLYRLTAHSNVSCIKPARADTITLRVIE